jgi:F-type H+-transporting ATPase subunit b
MIELNIALLATETVIFLLLLWVLNVILFKPILLHLDGRKKAIADGQNSVNDNADEVSALEAQAREIIHKAKLEALQIKEQAVSAAKGETEKRLNEKRASNEVDMKTFLSQLEDDRINLKNTLLGQAPLFKESLKAKLVSSVIVNG